MDSHDAHKLTTRGEAHLYAAIAKADGIVSRQEILKAPGLARAGRKVLDILGVNKTAGEDVAAEVRSVLEDPALASWSAREHLDEAIGLLKEAAKHGAWFTELVVHKHEEGLRQTALLDGYVMKESTMLKEIKRRLSELT